MRGCVSIGLACGSLELGLVLSGREDGKRTRVGRDLGDTFLVNRRLRDGRATLLRPLSRTEPEPGPADERPQLGGRRQREPYDDPAERRVFRRTERRERRELVIEGRLVIARRNADVLRRASQILRVPIERGDQIITIARRLAALELA
jgi:hypothetical protein